MRKTLNIAVILFVLTALAFGLAGCDGSADQAKADEMMGTDVKLNGTWKSQTVTYTHDGKRYSGQIELRFNDDQMQIVAPYGTSKIHRYTRNGIALNITDPYVSEDNPYRTFPFALEFDSAGFAVDLGALTFMEGADNIKLKFAKVGDSVSLKEPEEGGENPNVPANPNVSQEPTSLDAFVIEGTTLKGLTDYGQRLGSIVLPDTITTIGEYAFEDCTNLTSITIPSSVTEIGKGAFQGCSGLINITIPGSVTIIGNWTFSDCTSLTSVSIPNGVTEIGYEAFFCCYSLTNITIPNTVTTIGEYAFECCNSLTSITIPAGITSIGRSTFEDCTGLISVTIPDSVTVIGQEAFYRCEKLTSITIPSSVTEIGYEAFWGCSNLTDIYVNQTESTLLDNADVPDDCRIHWNESV